MSKKSNRGKAYFYAMGQRHRIYDAVSGGHKYVGLLKWSSFARQAYMRGYMGH